MQVRRIGFTNLSSSGSASDGPDRVNIIFVHGLRGHPLHTWEHSREEPYTAKPSKRTFKSFSGKPTSTNDEIEGSASRTLFWPHDYLSQDIPKATVWTYGYNADVIGGLFQANNGNSVSQHGRDLAVKMEREIDNEDPILFVVHSLGGIILKDALRRSMTCLLRTKLIIFLGTPHRGGASAGWGQIASNLASLALQDSNKTIIEALEVNSEVLDNIHEEFKNIVHGSGIKIHSFQEARGILGIEGLHQKVVDDFSSKLDLPFETVESIDANHMQMAKCSDREDPRYRAILSVLQQFIRSQRLSREQITSSTSRAQTQTTAAIELGATPEFGEAVEELKNASDEPEQSRIIHSGSGAINANTGSGTMTTYNNAGSGSVNHYTGQTQHFVYNYYGIVSNSAQASLSAEAVTIDSYSRDHPTRNVWMVPFERNESFTSRDSELEAVRKQLVAKNKTAKVAITGLGGIGKTHLVIELLYRLRDEEKDCFFLWIPATSEESLSQAYLKTAKELGIPGYDDKTADVKQLVQDHLSSEGAGRWVLVFDNADDISIWLDRPTTKSRRLLDYLPKSDRGSIIFTTCDKKVALRLAGRNIIEITAMDEAGSEQLLKNYLLDGENLLHNREDTAALLARLTYLPLAIIQAAAYINANEISLGGYLSLLDAQEEDVIDLLSEDFGDEGRYHDVKNAVATTWLISFARVRQRDSLAADYLSFMACVDAKDIPRSLLPPGPSQKKETDAMGTLQGYSFVSTRSTDSAINIHRLVHLATRNWLRKEGLLPGWTDRVITRLVDVLGDVDDENRVVWRTYMPHAYYALGSRLVTENDENRLVLLQRYGSCLFDDGRYNEAEMPFKRVMETSMTKLGADHPDTLTSMANLASTYSHQGRWEEAEKLFMQVMETSKTKLGANHSITLKSTVKLASTYRDQGRWKEAEKLFIQVLETRKTKLGADHPSTLTSMVNLAWTYRDQGRWEEAEKIEVQVLETSKTKLGANHPSTLTSIANLAATFWNQGRWEEAEKLFIQVLEIRKTKLGADHPSTLTSMANLASTYRDQGRWEEAEKLFVQVLETGKTKLGANHPDTITSMANLAWTHRNQGRWQEAEKLEVQVLETSKTRFGADHPSTLTSMVNLALTYKDQGRWEEAEKLFIQVMETSKTKLGVDHPITLMSIGNLASTYSNQGRWEDAEKLGVQVLETSKTKLGANHPSTLACMANLALTFWNQGRSEEAEKLFIQVLEIRKTKLGADHPSTLTSMANLASTFWSQDRWEEAEKLFIQVIETSKTKLGANHPITLKSMANLALTYSDQGRREEAEKLFVQVLETSNTKLGPTTPKC